MNSSLAPYPPGNIPLAVAILEDYLFLNAGNKNSSFFLLYDCLIFMLRIYDIYY